MKFDSKIGPRTIKVAEVNKELQHITFDEQWFCEGDTVIDWRDPDHDITLDTELGPKKFAYRGVALVGELYYVDRSKSIPQGEYYEKGMILDPPRTIKWVEKDLNGNVLSTEIIKGDDT